MKIFRWQRKLKSAVQDESTNKPNSNLVNEPGKEDVNEWLHGLLAIGTFGRNEDFEIRNNLYPTSKELAHKQDDDEQSASASELEQKVLSLQARSGNDVSVDNTKKDIGKRSLAFLLKKMFVCRSGFSLPPRSHIPESRMEKILRAIVHKKIYPQSSSSPSLLAKKYLENNTHSSSSNTNNEDLIDKESKGSKWVKTDSEYIVLEI